MPICFLIHERGWWFGSVGHGQLDVVTTATSIERPEPAQAIRATGRLWFQLLLLLGEEVSQPLSRPLEVLPVVVGEAVQVAKTIEGGVWNGQP